jgi:hypothetical protein
MQCKRVAGAAGSFGVALGPPGREGGERGDLSPSASAGSIHVIHDHRTNAAVYTETLRDVSALTALSAVKILVISDEPRQVQEPPE